MTKDEYKKLCEIELLFVDDDTTAPARGELRKFLTERKKEIIQRMANKSLKKGIE